MQISFDTNESLEEIVELLEHVYGVRITIDRPVGRSRHDRVAARDSSSSEPSGGTETT